MLGQIDVQIKPSKILAALLVVLYGGAMICLMVIPVYLWLKLIVIAILGWRFVISWRRYILMQGPNAVKHIGIAEDKWHLQNTLGKTWQADLRGDSIVTRYFIILNFKLQNENRAISIPIFHDNIDKKTMYELRKYLLLTKANK